MNADGREVFVHFEKRHTYPHYSYKALVAFSVLFLTLIINSIINDPWILHQLVNLMGSILKAKLTYFGMFEKLHEQALWMKWLKVLYF